MKNSILAALAAAITLFIGCAITNTATPRPPKEQTYTWTVRVVPNAYSTIVVEAGGVRQEGAVFWRKSEQDLQRLLKVKRFAEVDGKTFQSSVEPTDDCSAYMAWRDLWSRACDCPKSSATEEGCR